MNFDKCTVRVKLIFNILQLSCTYCCLFQLSVCTMFKEQTKIAAHFCLTLHCPWRQTLRAPDSESHLDPSITSAARCLYSVHMADIWDNTKDIQTHLNVPGRVISLHIKLQGLSDLKINFFDCLIFRFLEWWSRGTHGQLKISEITLLDKCIIT